MDTPSQIGGGESIKALAYQISMHDHGYGRPHKREHVDRAIHAPKAARTVGGGDILVQGDGGGA